MCNALGYCVRALHLERHSPILRTLRQHQLLDLVQLLWPVLAHLPRPELLLLVQVSQHQVRHVGEGAPRRVAAARPRRLPHLLQLLHQLHVVVDLRVEALGAELLVEGEEHLLLEVVMLVDDRDVDLLYPGLEAL